MWESFGRMISLTRSNKKRDSRTTSRLHRVEKIPASHHAIVSLKNQTRTTFFPFSDFEERMNGFRMNNKNLLLSIIIDPHSVHHRVQCNKIILISAFRALIKIKARWLYLIGFQVLFLRER